MTAVPAVHGPEDAERDADGFVNCEVTGFVLSAPDLPVIYVSGDNASIGTVAEIARRTPAIDAVVLHARAARVPARFGGRALSLDSIRAAAAAAILGPAAIIPAHYDGWTHFSEGRDDLIRAFDDAGLTARLRLTDHGTWIPLRALTPPVAALTELVIMDRNPREGEGCRMRNREPVSLPGHRGDDPALTSHRAAAMMSSGHHEEPSSWRCVESHPPPEPRWPRMSRRPS